MPTTQTLMLMGGFIVAVIISLFIQIFIMKGAVKIVLKRKISLGKAFLLWLMLGFLQLIVYIVFFILIFFTSVFVNIIK